MHCCKIDQNSGNGRKSGLRQRDAVLMQLNRIKNRPEPMTSHSGQWVQQESVSAISRDGISAGKTVNNNLSVQTGEEFSMEFIHDRATSKRVPVPDMAQNHVNVVGVISKQNIPMAYEELTKILGLQRMDSECGSDISEFNSAKGSTSEVDFQNYINKEFQNHKEDCAVLHGPRKAYAEMCYNQVGSEPSAPVINDSSSSQSLQTFRSGVSDGSQSIKIKFLCSFGGKILQRPSDGKLRYVGGDTRIISIRKALSWEELVKKTLGICKQPHTIKYQLPGEDLDALISVSCDEDLQNMIDEYYGLERLGGSQRLRIFLIPLSESERVSTTDADTIEQSNPDYQYVVALNGIADPSFTKNYNEQYLASEVSMLKPHLERSPSLCGDSSLHPLEIKAKLNESHLTSLMNESFNLMRSSNLSTLSSPMLSRQGDMMNSQTKLCKEISTHGSTESTSVFATTQLTPEKSRSDFNFPQVAANCNHTIKPVEVHSHIHNPSRDFVAPPRLNFSDTNLNNYCSEKPVLNERAFLSENPVTCPGDPVSPLLGSNESIGSHPVLLHAFSDSLLQECGRRSTYCSQEGMSPSSPLNFAIPIPLVSSRVISAALPEKPVQLQENINLINPEVQIKLLNTELNAPQRRANMVNDLLSSESLDRVENIYGEANCSGVRYQQGIKDFDDYNFMMQNYNKEYNLDCDTISGFDGKDPLLHQSGKVCDSRIPFNPVEQINISSNVGCDPISTLGVKTQVQDLQVSEGILPKGPLPSVIDCNPFTVSVMEQSQMNQLEKISAELTVKGQRTAEDQLHVLTGITGGEHISNISWAKSSEIAGAIQDSIQQSQEENSLNDLVCELSNGQVFHESTVPLPVERQNNILQEPMLISSDDLHQSAVCDDAGSNLNLNNFTLVQHVIKGTAFGEVSLLDTDLMQFPDQNFENSVLAQIYDEKQKFEDIAQSKYDEQKQLESVNVLGSAVDSISPGIKSSSAAVQNIIDTIIGDFLSPSAIEAEDTIAESDSEDAQADVRNKDECFTDAMIAEMEADIYGLQIIKNDDLEELRELGSGTYGTVYHGKWRGSDVAIKRIKKSCFSGRSSEQERLTKDFWREAQILSKLHHPNVVAFYGVVPDGAGGTLATVTEFMANGSLRNVLLKKNRSLDRRRKLIIAMDAAFGMEYLHSKNIVHFDLKCDNLLVNLRDPQRPICKVGDFGLSRIKRNTLVSGGVRGTLPWMAPELLNGSSNRVSEKVDVFSFGIAMWEILTGEEPYGNMHCGAIIGGIVKNTLRPPIPDRCDSEWKKLMEECWSADPEIRPSFTDITKSLRSMSAALQGKGPNNLAREGKS